MRWSAAAVAQVEVEAARTESVLDRTIDDGLAWMFDRQASDGHWVFELEADASMPADYIMLSHYLGDIDEPLERKIATYLRRRQGAHGGWSMYYDGEFDLSLSVRAYFALKIMGDDPEAPHMRRAREAILAQGGAAKVNVFTRYALALFEQIPWRGVPWMPAETMLLPKWAPFHLDKVSYWSRTVMVPLLVCSRSPATLSW